jgi:hypothetical protein
MSKDTNTALAPVTPITAGAPVPFANTESLPADTMAANDAKADLKAKTTVRGTLAVCVAVTDIEQWLHSNPTASPRERRIAERARDAFRRKLGEK